MALEISDRHSAGELRAMARREKNGRVASRMLAIANALDGMSRADAARAAGMDRQTLRDWVVRYGADGVAGLQDRPKGHPAPRLTEGELAALSNVIFRSPDPEKDGISTWTLSELCRWIGSRFGKSLHTTVREHMPSSHLRHGDWTIERIRKEAARIGSVTAILCDLILERRSHPEQRFRACIGILRLARPFGPSRLEAAAARAIDIGALSYGSVRSILDTRLDKRLDQVPPTQAGKRQEPGTDAAPILHPNIRGPRYYQ